VRFFQGDAMIFRQAEENEVVALNKLAFEAQAYWGFDEEYMARFAEVFVMGENYLDNHTVFVTIRDNKISGFFSVEENEVNELDFFYVRRDMIGRGVGREMWHYMLGLCRQKGIKELHWVTSPCAKPFYIKLGAEQVGTTRSIVDNNLIIPRLRYCLEPEKNERGSKPE